jgi:hypothetical protein
MLSSGPRQHAAADEQSLWGGTAVSDPVNAAGASADHPQGEASGEAVLVATVERLREEVDGLRQAMRSRALIEQAKGMLMERHGCTPDEAFERLAKLSQHANVKLADVAAALVDVTLTEALAARTPGRPGPHVTVEPPAQPTSGSGPGPATPVTPADVARAAREQLSRRWPRQGSGAGEFGIRVRAQGRRTRVRAELLAARAPEDLIGTLVRTAMTDHPPQAVALALVDVNGQMSMIGSHGIPGPVAARWRSLPVDLPLAVCATARSGRAQWLTATTPQGEPDEQPAAGTAAPALGLGLPDGWATAAVLPLIIDGECEGVVAMTWTDPRPPAEPVRAELERVVAGVAAVLRRLPVARNHAGAGRPAQAGTDPTLAVLDVLFHPVVLGEPVLDGDQVIDLRIRHANPAAEQAAPGPERLSGRRFLELWPDSARSGLFAACVRVLRTGSPADLPGQPWRLQARGRSHSVRADVRVTRYRDGVLITWTDGQESARPAGPAEGGCDD